MWGPAKRTPDLGFMARLMALCSLPRTNPGDRKEYKRVNGPYTLYMTAIGGNKLPFGNLPRLLLAWVCTEAVRTQSRVLVLGASLSGFMRKLDVLSSDSGGSWGIRTRLRNQMDRLFSATISLIYEDDGVKSKVISPVASRSVFWWDPKRPNERMLWESKIELGEAFFNEIIRHPVPLDMNTLKALKRCARPGSLPVAHLPDVWPQELAPALLEAVVPAVSPVASGTHGGGTTQARAKAEGMTQTDLLINLILTNQV